MSKSSKQKKSPSPYVRQSNIKPSRNAPKGKPAINKTKERTDAALLKRCRSGKFLDPNALAFTKLVDSPTTAKEQINGLPVSIPLDNGLPQCPKVVIKTYGARDYTPPVLTASPLEHAGAIWVCPEGHINAADGDRNLLRKNIGGASVIKTLGPESISTAPPVCGWTAETTAALADASFDQMWNSGTSLATANYGSLDWDVGTEVLPQLSTSDHQSTSFKMIAFAIRVIFTGRAEDAQGYAECYQTFEMPEANSPDGLYKANAQFKTHYFGRDPVALFVAKPNCDTYAESHVQPTVIDGMSPCRFKIKLRGLTQPLSFRIETIGYYQLTNPKYQQIAHAGRLSPHQAALKAAVTSSFVNGKSLTSETIVHHASTHPVLAGLLHAGEDVLEGLGGMNIARTAVGMLL